jgi:hypothetical protein
MGQDKQAQDGHVESDEQPSEGWPVGHEVISRDGPLV